MIGAGRRFKLSILSPRLLAWSSGLAVVVLCACCPGSFAAQPETGLVKMTGRTYAWIARDDRSSNSALFVGDTAALVVDPGLTPAVAREFLTAVHAVTDKPVRWAVLTHWHPDHSFGALCLQDEAFELVAHPETRRLLAERAAQIRSQLAEAAPDSAERAEISACQFRLPDKIVAQKTTFDLGGLTVEVFHPGAGHTQGDLVVWAPQEKVLATGDLFLRDSSPYMGEGSTLVWIAALDSLAALQPAHVVPGHFGLSELPDMLRFRRYLQAVVDKARAALDRGANAEQAGELAAFPEFSDFLQYPQYDATFEANLRVVMKELAGKN